jgi:hypothetical protein
MFSPEGDKIAVRTAFSPGVMIADIKSGSVSSEVVADEIRGISRKSTTEVIMPKGKLPEWAEWDKFDQQHPVIKIAGGLIRVTHGSERVTFNSPTSGAEIASFIDIEPNDWLITTPEGFFDGTADAWKRSIWRFNNNTFDYGAVELYFNEFFRPGLLQEIVAGKIPTVTDGGTLASRDRRQPIVKIASINDKSTIGISEQAAPQTTAGHPVVTVAVDVTDSASDRTGTLRNARSGAIDLRLFRNGQLVKIWHGDVFNLPETSGCERKLPTLLTQPRSIRCKVPVPIVAGDNTFTAYAFNSSGVKSLDDVVTFKNANQLRDKGTFYILAVGVNEYRRLGNLKYAVNDVTELAEALEREQKKLGIYDSIEAITLTNAQATKENIFLALSRFKNGTQRETPPNTLAQLRRIKPLHPEDALIIVFSGHGVAVGDSFYIMPSQSHPGRLRETGISDTELKDALEQVDGGHLLLIIDACQSGKVLGRTEEGRGPVNSKGLAQLAYDKGMTILAASQSYQAALEVSRTETGKDIRHGLLTYALLTGLANGRTTDASGDLLERAWLDYAVNEVPRLQIAEMEERLRKGSQLLFTSSGREDGELDERIQVPRVFYRREEDLHPLIVSRP